jgi:hypothetical protein
VCQSLIKPANEEQFLGKRSVGGRVARAATQGFAETADRGNRVLRSGTGQAEVVGLSKVGFNGECALERGGGIVPALLTEQGEAKLNQAIKRFGLDGEMALE